MSWVAELNWSLKLPPPHPNCGNIWQSIAVHG